MATANRRVFYAIERVGVTSDLDATTYTTIHGAQSVGSTVSFNVENILELGQIDNYTTMEDRPDVNMTIEKLFDGFPLAYHAATSKLAANDSTSSLSGRTRDACKLLFAVYPDTQTIATGDAKAYIVVSGAYVDSLDYNLVVDGNFTESVTFVANDRVWGTGNLFADSIQTTPSTDGNAIMKRWNVVMGSGTSASLWPKDIDGIDSNGYNLDAGTNYGYNAHIQSVRISVNLGRTDLYELGRKAAYYRYANFPVEVTTAIETSTSKGDLKNAYAETTNVSNQIIKIIVQDDADAHTVTFDLGSVNKLTSIDQSGGDTSGGVATVTYNYTNQNTLTITSDDDPAGQ